MNIMYATDDNYAEICGVSLESLLENNKAVEDIMIFIVVDGVSQRNAEKLKRTAEKYDRKIVFIPKPDIRKLTGTDLLTLRWSDSAFSRLYLDLVFKDYPDVKKLLYLDCDTMILDILEPLWNIDISNCLGAAVLECMGDWHKKIVGSKATDHFFNSGVMLLNVEEWKKERVGQRCTDFIKARKGKIEYVDQGVINGVLVRELKVVDSPRYNLTALSWDFTYEEMQIYRKPHHGYSKSSWEEAKKNPAIIHFTTSFLSTRPWFEGSRTPWTGEWRKYRENSEWKDEPSRIMKDRASHDRIIRMFNKLPRKMAVGIAGMLHAYAKPAVFALKNGMNIKSLKNEKMFEQNGGYCA